MAAGEELDSFFLYNILEGVTKDDKFCKYCTEAITRQTWKTW